MSNLFDDAAKRASRYLESLNTRSVAPKREAIAALARFDQAFPDHTSSAESVLAELDEIGSPATMASAGGRFFGFVIGGALPATVAANWLATTWDQNAGLVVTSPINAALENVSLRWLKAIFHLPSQSAGGFVTSATAANFSALAAARHMLLARAGWDVEARGLFGAPPLTVVVGDEVHASMLKALSLVGFGRERVLRVPVDAQGRMCFDEFPDVDDRTVVCVQAGNVNSGAFDPIQRSVRALTHMVPGCTSTAPLACGLRLRPREHIWSGASKVPTPGPRMLTSGSTSLMTAAWCSLATRMHYARQCPSAVPTSHRMRIVSHTNIRPTSRAARAESKFGPHCGSLAA